VTEGGRTPACVWRVTAELLIALDERFSSPTDAYVNGSQVWLRDDGSNGETLEWRLHPVSSYSRPKGMATDDVFDTVVFALATGAETTTPFASLWEGLEAFPGFGDDIEPARLAAACNAALGIAPDAFGLVDHDTIGDHWEAAAGKRSIIADLFTQLAG
jgi:hypothetical protein